MSMHVRPGDLISENSELEKLRAVRERAKEILREWGEDGTAGEFAELPPLEADEPITDDERSHYADSVFISWEMADPRDRWKWTGEASPPLVPDDKPAAKPYRTPQSTIDAFLYWIVRQDAKTQARWLAERPKDASYLQTLLEAK